MSLRLILLAGVALLFASLVAAMFWYRGQAIGAQAERDKARADLRVAVEANRTNLDTIAKLRAEAEANDRLVADMAEQLEAIAKSVEEANQALDELGKTNEDVRDYLSGRVPGELERLLNQ